MIWSIWLLGVGSDSHAALTKLRIRFSSSPLCALCVCLCRGSNGLDVGAPEEEQQLYIVQRDSSSACQVLSLKLFPFVCCFISGMYNSSQCFRHPGNREVYFLCQQVSVTVGAPERMTPAVLWSILERTNIWHARCLLGAPETKLCGIRRSMLLEAQKCSFAFCRKQL